MDDSTATNAQTQGDVGAAPARANGWRGWLGIKTRTPVDLLISNSHGRLLAAFDEDERTQVLAAIDYAQEQLRRKHSYAVRELNNDPTTLAIEHGRYTVVVFVFDGQHIIGDVSVLEMRSLLQDDLYKADEAIERAGA